MVPVNGPVSPWWRHPMVWLVISGPASVVAACIATAIVLLRQPDPPLEQQPAVTAQQAPAEDAGPETQPALLARNHAATGGR